MGTTYVKDFVTVNSDEIANKKESIINCYSKEFPSYSTNDNALNNNISTNPIN